MWPEGSGDFLDHMPTVPQPVGAPITEGAFPTEMRRDMPRPQDQHDLCPDCSGSRAVPDDLGEHEDGYAPCPSCVIDAESTFVVWESTA